MIRVGLVSTFKPEACGHAMYADELMRSTEDPDVEYKIIGRPLNAAAITERIQDCDVVHVNHAWQLFGDLNEHVIASWKAAGKKTVCTFHESSYENRSAFTVAFDRVVVHWKSIDGFTHIPDGILDNGHKVEDGKDFIGIVGFPFDYKNYPLCARIAQTLGAKLFAFIPESNHIDYRPVMYQLQLLNPGCTVITDLRDQEFIIKTFSTCLFTMFPYAHTGSGIGGSVRLGIAAKRPVLISNVVRFDDLRTDYADEFYITPTAYPTFENTLPVAGRIMEDIDKRTARIPYRTLEDMNWKKSASRYVEIYKELMNVG